MPSKCLFTFGGYQNTVKGLKNFIMIVDKNHGMHFVHKPRDPSIVYIFYSDGLTYISRKGAGQNIV